MLEKVRNDKHLQVLASQAMYASVQDVSLSLTSRKNVYCFMIYHIYSYTYMVVYTFTGSHRFYKADDIAKY